MSPELTYPLAASLDDGGSWTTIEENVGPSVTPWKEGAESDRMRLSPMWIHWWVEAQSSGLEEQQLKEYGQVLPEGGKQLKARDEDDMLGAAR